MGPGLPPPLVKMKSRVFPLMTGTLLLVIANFIVGAARAHAGAARVGPRGPVLGDARHVRHGAATASTRCWARTTASSRKQASRAGRLQPGRGHCQRRP
jgi:hypothetical protein